MSRTTIEDSDNGQVFNIQTSSESDSENDIVYLKNSKRKNNSYHYGNKPKKAKLDTISPYKTEYVSTRVPPIVLSRSVSDDSYDQFRVKPDGDANEVLIKETYELGYQNECHDQTEMYVLDFFDTIEVNYLTTVANINHAISSIEPLLLQPSHSQQLFNIAVLSLKKLARHILEWLEEYKKDFPRIWGHRVIECHNMMVVLRRQMFCILNSLVPDLNTPKAFDCTSPDLEKILFRVTSQLACTSQRKAEKIADIDQNSPSNAVFYSANTANPEYFLEILQDRILAFLKIVLPHFQIPEQFDKNKDLCALLDAVHAYNTQ